MILHILSEKNLSFKAFLIYFTSNMNRFFLYSGFLGLIVYIIYNISLILTLNKVKHISAFELAILKSTVDILLLSSFLYIIPFQTRALWFIPALIDGLYIKQKSKELKHYERQNR